MKISCNSRRWFQKRYFFSILSSGLVKENCSTKGIVVFFGTRDMNRGFSLLMCMYIIIIIIITII